MTANLNFEREAYIYAQTLENNGQSEYWLVSRESGKINKIKESDILILDIQSGIDFVYALRQRWTTTETKFDCRISLNGLCTITIHPLTLDVDGRISPVVLLFNVLGPFRHRGLLALTEIQYTLNRKFSESDISNLTHLMRILRWPSFFIFLHIVFHRQKASND